MKITRFTLILVAALSMGLTVLARAHASTHTKAISGSSTFKVHDDNADDNGSEF
jgi:hypothetical protein